MARPRKTKPAQSEVDAVAEVEVSGKDAPEVSEKQDAVNRAEKVINEAREKANGVLEDAKGQYDAVVVLGLNDKGGVDVQSNYPQYAFIDHIMNRAQLQLLLHEEQSLNR